jgi:predicted transcriptional regulator
MKQQHGSHYHPHREHRSNLEIIANILKLTVTRVENRNKITYKAIIHKASPAYEHLSYYLEVMINYLEVAIVKGVLDQDRTE